MDNPNANDTAICPNCRTKMTHVAVTPHPVARNMLRTTFVCYTCKRTRTYMLAATTDDVAPTSGVAAAVGGLPNAV